MELATVVGYTFKEMQTRFIVW